MIATVDKGKLSGSEKEAEFRRSEKPKKIFQLK